MAFAGSHEYAITHLGYHAPVSRFHLPSFPFLRLDASQETTISAPWHG